MLWNLLKTLEFNQFYKSNETPFIISPDLESLIKKLDGYKNNPENLSTKKVSEHVQVFQFLQYHNLKPSKISMMYTEVKMKKFSKTLRRNHKKWIINFVKKIIY